MAYQALVIPVMIASPGDVEDERNIVREVLHDWNDVNASKSRVVLVPVGWDTHSAPELGARPQELINSRVLDQCDLLIGVFWTRIGTPTGEAVSGTVEEIEKHVAAGKPAMIYFSSRPAAPETIVPSQYKHVKDFKDSCGKLGLIESYDSVDDFRRKISKHLPICLYSNDYLKELTGSNPDINPDVEIPETRPNEHYSLNEEARALLKAAASEHDGTILKIAVLSGRYIQAGKQKFGDSDSRTSAKWEAALDALLDYRLVVERGYKGEVFELTHEGWSVADAL